jgi:hypothetical protein
MCHRSLFLARAFFGRFFESDLMQQGLAQVQLAIWALALVIAPGLLLTLRSALTYSGLRLAGDVAGLHHAMLLDRLLLFTLSMAVLGVVDAIIWEGVFPDRRDARHFGVLPLPGGQLILARLAALSAMAALFLAGVNLIPTLGYGALAAEYGDATSTARGVLAHGIAAAGAGTCAFFTVLALQGALLNLAGRRVAERLGVILQVSRRRGPAAGVVAVAAAHRRAHRSRDGRR